MPSRALEETAPRKAILSKSHLWGLPSTRKGDLKGGNRHSERGERFVSAAVDISKNQAELSWEGGPRDKTHVAGPFLVTSSFQALEKLLVADLSGSQNQNNHYLNNLRMTALEDGQENYPPEKVKLSMSLAAPSRCVSHSHRALGSRSRRR